MENLLLLIAAYDLDVPKVEADKLLGNGISTALWITGVLSVAVIIFAAFRIVSARGDVDKAKKGQREIVWGLVGLVITILAGVIVSVVANTAGN